MITLFALTGKYAGIIASSMFFGRFVGRFVFPSIHSSIHLFIDPFIHSLIHSFIHSLIHPFIHLYLTCSYIWGILSDSWGRRPVLIISVILLGLSSLSFGFSVNFAMAVCMRFMVGLTNGKVT